MLGSDLVRATRRGDTLHLTKIKGTERAEVEEIAAGLIEILESSLGLTLDELGESLAAVPRSSRHEKIWAGLKKLALDGCEFGTQLDVDAPALRKEVFVRASQARKDSSAESPFDRDEILATVAAKYEATPEAIEEGLFGDLKGAARLSRATLASPESLVEEYELAQIQGVLLKAVRLTVDVECGGPDQARRLFQKLKFRRLLYRLESRGKGAYRIEIEGPFSLFESVTKYGLQLALIVPALLECQRVELSAELRWGKERRTLGFSTVLKGEGDAAAEVPLRSDVEGLLQGLEKKKSAWKAQINDEMFDVPGVGICIPDLKLIAKGREAVFVEVLGFWSREAVWKRVEWAEAEANRRVIFAVSSRLRVSEEVLPESTGSALYVYKGTMSPVAVIAQAESLSASR